MEVKPPGVFVVIRGGAHNMVFVQHGYSSNGYQPGLYSLPGGALRPGETLEAAAVREVLEETGFFVLPTRKIGVFELQRSLGQVHLFEGQIVGGELTNPDNDEITDVAFYDPSVDPIILYPAQQKLIAWAEHHQGAEPIEAPLVMPASVER